MGPTLFKSDKVKRDVHIFPRRLQGDTDASL
jgi:hypothetical protein